MDRAPVSKTGGWGFDPLHSCHDLDADQQRHDQPTPIHPRNPPGSLQGCLAEPQGNHDHHRNGVVMVILASLFLSSPTRSSRGCCASCWASEAERDGHHSALVRDARLLGLREESCARASSRRPPRSASRDMFEEILVPTEEVVEVRRGSKVNAERKFFPGYVLIKMHMTDDTWHLVKNTPKVTGFLGGGGKPVPISETEASRIHGPDQRRHRPSASVDHLRDRRTGAGQRRSVHVVQRHGGRSRRRAMVSIFGRSTPVELEYTQVEKL